MKQLNVFDFDHTIYSGDASLDYIIFCLKHHAKTWLFLLIILAAFIRFIIDRDRKKFKEAAFSFLRVVPGTSVDQFWESHEHKVKSWYLNMKKSDDIIISASPDFLLEPMARRLSVTLIATRMDSRTGKIKGENCRGVEKVTRLNEYNKHIKIEGFYTDHVSDTPLAKVARKAYLVRGDTIKAFELQQ